VSHWSALLALVLSAEADHGRNAGGLPVCSNRTINEVVKRVGCTVGDARCWLRSGGFCNDYVEQRLGAGRPDQALELVSIGLQEVARGDVAVFAARAHYAYVEGVRKGKDGQVVAVDLSEHNFGSCWVDKESLVTDQYKALGRRSALPVGEVDGGFLRARPAAR
jgi:hypothetical protein